MKSKLLPFLIISVVATNVALVSLRLYPTLKRLFTRSHIEQVAATETITPLATTLPSAIPLTKISPNRISFPSLELSLPVAEATIVDNSWALYDDKVSWLSTSQTPGLGNVIIYGHNRKPLFGRLRELAIDDVIEVEHQGSTYSYKVVEKRKVAPSEVDAVLSARDQLTLYTCDGAFDQKRLVVIAVPLNS